jgi:pyridoxine/pyridoxamine 5'-phosphate oxidase
MLARMSPSDRKPPRASRPHSPGYGIVGEHEGQGLLPWSWAQERLAAARNYFISTTRPDGRPHVSVIWGLWLDDAFYFSTSMSSRKGRNLAANPSCVIVPEDGEEAVIVEGVVSEFSDGALVERFNREYKIKYDWDVSTMSEPKLVLTPRVVFAQIEKTFTQSATRWRFDD